MAAVMRVPKHVDHFIENIGISPFLKARIQTRCTSNINSSNQRVVDSSSDKGYGTLCTAQSSHSSSSSSSSSPFVLYLPTVNLRNDQNPAFALACHIANQHNVPLLVLAVLLDDHHMPLSSPFCSMNQQANDSDKNNFKQITMTARRLAFLLEALTQCAKEWSDHGAGVAIRVHRPNGGRIADHLTLASRATAVVTDEPFVHPFVSFVHKVEKVCRLNYVPCWRVDGSTTVPPCSVLKKRQQHNNNGNDDNNSIGIDDQVYYDGVPAKAWMWQKRTEHLRGNQIEAAMNGDFDAPVLQCRIENDDFFISHPISSDISDQNDADGDKHDHEMMNTNTFPLHWRKSQNEAPGVRPWTVSELNRISNIKEWATQWSGSDSSVLPCSQTIGTTKAGMQRWNNWISARKGLIYYAKRRTDPLQPHASSRMSCYLNFGIVSIFRLVHEVKTAQKQKVNGADKFEEEIVKWREMSYAHSFSRGDYHTSNVVPKWAKRWLTEMKSQNGSNSGSKVTDLSFLSSGNSGDETWDGMQQYLVNTGELHNNVRMTWGKMLVHWNHHHVKDQNPNSSSNMNDDVSVENLMQTLCYLNDRYALDGLSPPSYAGLLWCVGWCDKPDKNGGISVKRRYKLSGYQFKDAEAILFNDKVDGGGGHEQTTIISSFSNATVLKRTVTNSANNDDYKINCGEKATLPMKRAKKNTLHQYFQSSSR